MAAPDIQVQIAFTSGYTTPAASRAWTDVTAYVEGDRGISIDRGRPDQFSAPQPSRLTLTLNNTDGRFTPENTAGAYYPNVKKGRPIRVRTAGGSVSDAFGRADSTTAIGTADVGGTWTALTGTWGISSGQAYNVAGPGDDAAVLTSPGADVLVTANVTLGSGGLSGVIARCVDINNYYLAQVDTAGQVSLYKRVGGTYTQLGSSTATGVFTTGGVLGLQTSGTTISALVNGTTVISVTDSAFSSAGYVGIRVGATRTNWRWDNFSAVTPLASTRFMGYVDEWPVEWPGDSSTWATTTITATSRQARLGRGATLKSIVEEEILYDAPVLYFPLGEPTGSTTAGNITPGRSEVLTVTQYGTGGAVTFGTGTGPGTDDLSTPTFAPVDVNNGKYLMAALSTPVTVTGDHHLEAECFFTATAGGSVAELVVGMGDDVNNLGLLLGLATTGQPFAAFNVPGTPIYGSGAAIGATSVRDGQLHHGVVRVALTDPATITMSLILDGVVTTGTPQVWPYTGGGVAFFPGLIRLFAGGGPSGAMFTGTVAHVAVFTQQTTTLATSRFDDHRLAGTTGFAGESSDARIRRYARYAGIPAAEMNV